MTAIDSPPADRKLHLFPFELALFGLIFWADGAGFIPLSKTPFLFLVAWASLRLRGSGWPRPAFAATAGSVTVKGKPLRSRPGT